MSKRPIKPGARQGSDSDRPVQRGSRIVELHPSYSVTVPEYLRQ